MRETENTAYARKREFLLCTDICGSALDVVARAHGTFDIIFWDPPYQTGLLEKALEQIAAFDILNPHGIIVAESAVETELPALAPPYSLYRQYRYGKIKLSVYHRSGNEDTL